MMQDKRAVLFCLTILLLAGTVVGYAAVPQSTIQTTVPGGITTYVGHYVNSTLGYWMGTTEIIDNTRAASFVTLDTGHGANELYAMNQDVETTDAVTFLTVDTGQGANDLWDMDQNVETTSTVSFSSVEADEFFLSSVNITDSIINADPGGNPTFVNITATNIYVSSTLDVDTINEYSNGDGLTIDGVVLRDGAVLPEGQVYGVQWNVGTDTWTQVDIDGATITPTTDDFNNHTVWGSITRVNLASDGTVNARYGDGDYAVDGSNGEVMVEIPAFYVKGEQTTSQVYQWWISGVPLTGFEIHPAFLQRDGRPKAFIYVGAYESSLMVGTGVHDADTTLKLHTRSSEQPWTGGEIDALPYDSGSTEFTRGETITGATGGGTADVIDWTLTGGTWGGGDAAGTVYIKQNAVANFQAENLDGSVGGANMAGATGVQVAESLDIGEARTYGSAHGEGWGQMGIWSLSAVKLLFVVEYGNMDSQTEVGRGVVDLASGAGYAGLETAAASVDSNLDAAGTGVGTGADGDVPATYRYMENLWGNVYAFIDGYNAVDAEYRLIERNGDGTFADGLATYEASSMAPITTDGYISDIEWDRIMKYLFIASATGGGAGTYIPDYQYSHDAGETNILLAGGLWYDASAAGLGHLYSTFVASTDERYIGARAEYAP